MSITKDDLRTLPTGTVLARDDVPYPQGAVEMTRWKSGGTSLCPIGGGFVLKEEILERFSFHVATAEELGSKWQPAEFAIDDGPRFQGYTDQGKWNGWACPRFGLDTAKSVVAYFKDTDGQNSGVYDEATDQFLMHNSDYPDEEQEVYGSVEIEVGGAKIKTYGIGSGSWCWDNMTDYDREEANEDN
jgi:hypothetical protein